MSDDDRENFRKHIRRLERQALKRPRTKRSRDAVRSLACMVLLIEESDPDPSDEKTVVELRDYVKAVAR
jgi:hypothetical protein